MSNASRTRQTARRSLCSDHSGAPISHIRGCGISKITLRIVADQNHVYIDPEDADGGIPATALPGIFELFLPQKHQSEERA